MEKKFKNWLLKKEHIISVRGKLGCRFATKGGSVFFIDYNQLPEHYKKADVDAYLKETEASGKQQKGRDEKPQNKTSAAD